MTTAEVLTEARIAAVESAAALRRNLSFLLSAAIGLALVSVFGLNFLQGSLPWREILALHPIYDGRAETLYVYANYRQNRLCPGDLRKLLSVVDEGFSLRVLDVPSQYRRNVVGEFDETIQLPWKDANGSPIKADPFRVILTIECVTSDEAWPRPRKEALVEAPPNRWPSANHPIQGPRLLDQGSAP
jgi:hypothetical protein